MTTGKRGRKPGHVCSADTRAKMSAARKAAWADPAVRAKMSAARKAALAEKHRAERARAAAFAKPRREKHPKAPPDKSYDFKHIRAQAAPDAIPAIPTLAEALGA